MAAKSPHVRFRPTTCVHHKGRSIELFCKSCDQGACIKCVSSVHQSHTICDLADISSQKKINIQEFINKTERTELAQADKHIKSTEKLIRDNSVHFQKLKLALKKQNDKLKQDLDLLMAEKLSLYQRLADENAAKLNTCKSTLESYKSQLNHLLHEYKSTLQRGTDLEIYDIVCEIHSDVTQPEAPNLGTASFTPNTNPRGYLEQALGMSVTISCPGQASVDHDWAVESVHQRPSSTQPWSASDDGRPSSTQLRSASDDGGPSSTQQRSASDDGRPSSTQLRSASDDGRPSSTQLRSASDDGRPVTRPPPQSTLLPQTKVLGEFGSACEISSLCPTSDGGAWASYTDSPTLTLLDTLGIVQQEIMYNKNITDISLSHNTHSVWSCHEDDNSIMELVSGKPTLRFKVDSKPWCIGVTRAGHIIVGMERRISKYTTKGKVVLTRAAAEAGKPLVNTPYRISECRVTRNVAVADWDDISYGCEGKPHVLVMDKNLRELFRYRGVIPGNPQQTIQTAGSFPFDPYGLVYDRVGNLVIGDSDNKRVLLVSGRGQFLRTIHTDTRDNTWAVGIDRGDLVWAVFGWGDIKLLKYTTMARSCTII